MTVWFTADTHFHHRNINALAGRPFDDLDQMNEVLIRNWNDCVEPDDDIWVLGDYVLGHKEQTLAITKRLAGNKYLVIGNHDGPFDRRPLMAARWVAAYLRAGFSGVMSGPVGYQLFGHPVLLSHFPYDHDERHESKYAEHHPVDAGLPLIHGHVHGAWMMRGPRQLNVGVDKNAYAPVREIEVWRAFRDAGAITDEEQV